MQYHGICFKKRKASHKIS